MSRLISSAQRFVVAGYVPPPVSFTLAKQPSEVEQVGSPYSAEKAARSVVAVGSLKASTTAIVSPDPPAGGKPYAVAMAPGESPDGGVGRVVYDGATC
jgi:hypothetical protein